MKINLNPLGKGQPWLDVRAVRVKTGPGDEDWIELSLAEAGGLRVYTGRCLRITPEVSNVIRLEVV